MSALADSPSQVWKSTFRQLLDRIGDKGLATAAKLELLEACVCDVVVDTIPWICICRRKGAKVMSRYCKASTCSNPPSVQLFYHLDVEEVTRDHQGRHQP